MLNSEFSKKETYQRLDSLYLLIEKFKQLKEYNENLIEDLLSNLEDLDEHLLGLFNDYNNIGMAIDHAIIVAATDTTGKIIDANKKFCEISKYSREELIGKNHRILNSGEHSSEFFKKMWRTILIGDVWSGEIKNKASDGTYYWVKSTIIPLKDVDGKPFMFLSLRVDITDVKDLEKKYQLAIENDFRRTVESLHNFVFKLRRNEKGDIVYTMFEGKLARELNLYTDIVYGKTPAEVYDKEFGERIDAYYKAAFEGQATSFEITYMNRDFVSVLSPIYENAEVVEVIGSVNEITDLKISEQNLLHMAYHDTLTSLYNREKLYKDLNELEKTRFACFMLDLIKFKQVNDRFGHSVGDLLLKEVANHLKSKLADERISIYRWGGDEFVIIKEYEDISEVHELAASVHEWFSDHFQVGDHNFSISTRNGISLYPETANDISTVIKQAEMAMYELKRVGTYGNFFIYNKEIEEKQRYKALLEQDLRTALQEDPSQIIVHYQPKLDCKKNKVSGVEALVRWIHPEKGLISPMDFIPIAEDSGLIHALGELVLRKACSDIRKIIQTGYDITVAVNISSLQFQLPGFVSSIKKVLEETELAHQYLEIELTESQFMDDVEQNKIKINRLKELGISISLDDFGTGYSSLSYIKSLNLDKIKIDRSFIKDIQFDLHDQEITFAIIRMAEALNIKIVAEGVENREILDLLKTKGCHEIQGFYYSRPIDYNHLVDFLEENTAKL